MEKRRYQRIFPLGLSAEISDGIGFYKGFVSNISMNGIKIEELPSRIDGKSSWYIAVIKDHDACFQIYIKPKWSVLQGANSTIGGMIVDPSWHWASYVHTLAEKPKTI